MGLVYSFGYVLLFIFLTSCSKPVKDDNNILVIEKDTVIFSESIAMGTLNNSTINEASGMVSSLSNKHTFWTHNDSGDEARLFLIDSVGQHLLDCYINNATNRDWEDIALIKDAKDGRNKIFIADIGDNSAKYDHGIIYIFEEPDIKSYQDISIDYDLKLIYKYEDGPRDAETLIVDPLTGDIFIVSKREANVQLYQIPYPYFGTDTLIAKKVLTLPFTQIVAGDISFDGKEILLKNYQNVWYWVRKNNQSVTEALSKKPYETSYVQEPQGESVCWSPYSKAFFTISEETSFKIKPVLYKYVKSK